MIAALTISLLGAAPALEPSLISARGPGAIAHRVALLPSLGVAQATAGGAAPEPAGGAALTLDDVLQAADRAYPSLAAAQADLEAADAEALSAAGGFDPVAKARGYLIPPSLGPYPQVRVDSAVEGAIPGTPVTLFGGYRIGQPLSSTGIQTYYRERETYPAGELRAGISAPLLRNLLIDRRRASISRAALGQDGARQAQTLQRIEVTRLAALRYWEWVAAGRRREVARSLLAIAEDRDRQLAVRVKTGDVPFFDQQDNLRAVAQRRSLLVQTQRAVEQASFELALFLRDGDGAPTQPLDAQLPASFPEPLPSFGDEATLDEALSRRPDVQRLVVQQRQQEIDLSLARNQLWPALDMGVVFSQDLGRNAGTADPKLNVPELELFAILEVPLLYRLPMGRVRAAEAGLAKVAAQLRLARDRVAADVKDARSALEAARARVILARQEVDVARKLEAGERQKFALGDSTLLFVNLRETQSAEASLREIDSLQDYHRAVALFRAAVAAPF